MKSLFVVALIFCASGVSSQTNSFGYTPRLLGQGTLPPVEADETVQGKYLKNVWSKGKVLLKYSDRFVDLPLQFDQYDNTLYFLQDGNMMTFAEPVKEFQMQLIVKEDTIIMHYRNGYPPIHRNTESTFYEILVDGKFQLLRCKAKTIALYKNIDLPEERRDYKKEMLYAFLPNGKIINVSKDKDELLSSMATYKEAAEKVIDEKKLKIRSEATLRELFEGLNK